MSDVRTLLERGYADASPPPDGFERILRRRDRKRRNQRITAGVVGIAVFVAAIWVVTSVGSFDRTQPGASGGAETGPTATGPALTRTDAPDTDWYGEGLAPEGAIPSSPETGELIADYITPLGGGDVFVYADGRVIFNHQSYGQLSERRLTPEAVDLVRSGAIKPENLHPPVLFGVPAGAWADAEFRPYVPSWYAVCYYMKERRLQPTVNGGYEYPSRVLPFFPSPARAILRGEVSHGIVGGAAGDPDSPECSAVTTEEGRALEEMLSDSTVEDSEGDRILWEAFLPILPHGAAFNSGG